MSLLHHTWVWSSSDVIVSLCKTAAKASSGKTCLWASRCGQKRFSCVAAVLEWQSLMQSFCQPTSHLERSIHCSSSRYIWLMVNRKVGTIPPRTTPSSQRQWILYVPHTSPCSTIVGAAFKGGRHSLQTVVWVHFWQFLKELQSVKLVARLAYTSVIATS